MKLRRLGSSDLEVSEISLGSWLTYSGGVEREQARACVQAALTEVVRAGKARYIGFSEWPAERIEQSLALADVERWVSSQPQYSMLWRRPEAEVIPLCEREQISQIVWSPLAQGVLTGKYLPGQPPPAGSRATSESMGGFIDRLLEPPVLEAD